MRKIEQLLQTHKWNPLEVVRCWKLGQTKMHEKKRSHSLCTLRLGMSQSREEFCSTHRLTIFIYCNIAVVNDHLEVVRMLFEAALTKKQQETIAFSGLEHTLRRRTLQAACTLPEDSA